MEAQASEASPGTGASYYRLKKVQVIDEHGFERPMPALTLLVPPDWKLTSSVQWGRTAADEMVRVVFHATAPDGVTGIELMPAYSWQWSDDPLARQSMQAASQSAAQFGGRATNLMPPVAARDLLAKVILPRLRPGARVAGIEPIPELEQVLRAQVQQAQAGAARAGLQLRISADHARARVYYTAHGKPVEEWVTAVTTVRALPMPAFNPMTGQMAQTTSYQCEGNLIFGLRAPRGTLDANEKLFQLVLSTLRLEPAWQARVAQMADKVAQVQAQGVRDRPRILARNAEEISRIHREGTARRERVQGEQQQQFSQLIRGVETYRNPGTGEEVELNNRYGRAWTNGLGEYVMTDAANFNPDAALHGSWTQMEKAKP